MSYFGSESTGEGHIRIERAGEVPDLPMVEGIRCKPIVGTGLNIQEVVLEPNALAPVHTHEEEQLGYVVSGSLDFTDGTATWRLGPGDFYAAPPGVPHGATALDVGAVVIDAFSPPRDAVLRLIAEHGGA